MNMIERHKFYNEAFPNRSQLWTWKSKTRTWVLGQWMLGNRYQGSGYYGSYPAGYIEMVMSMFEDVPDDEIIHLFSGSVKARGIKFDINPDLEPDVCGDAKDLVKLFQEKSKTLILADCPYTDEDATHYGHPMINRTQVFRDACKILRPKGIIGWLDQIQPSHVRAQVNMVASIGIMISAGHRFRELLFYQRDEVLR